jgi:Peptidase A4 family
MSVPTGRGRVRLVVGLTAIVGLVCGFGTAQAGAAAVRASRGDVLVPTKAHEKLPLHGGTADSLNWAGYAVTPGSGVTAVDSTFIVPSAGTVPPGFSATWAGIGGYTTSDLIQAGVSEQSLSSNSLLGDQYYAWYEILPAGETQISGCNGDANCTVNPGDSITVDIHNVSGDTWSINLTDEGHWTYSDSVTYASSESSAEWIQEAPTLVAVQTIPASVGDVAFGPTSTYTVGGSTETIATGDPTLIEESPVGGVNEATTSALAADGQSFDVCVYAQSCSAP